MPREEIKMIMDPAMVLLSALMSYIGSYMAISLLEQLRLYQVNVMDAEMILQQNAEQQADIEEQNSQRSSDTNNSDISVSKKKYLFGSKEVLKFSIVSTMACAIGGVGIWSMHMVSMAAMKLEYKGVRMPLHFHLGLTVFSLFAVVACCIVGMYVASDDLLFAKTKNKIVEEYIKNKTTDQIRKMGKLSTLDLLWMLIRISPHKLVMGAMLAAAGICVMHYVGMDGIIFQGVIEWDIGILVLSVIIAIIAANAAFWVLFRFLSTFNDNEGLRIAAALIFTIAECAVHYTGMVAAKFYTDTEELSVEGFPSQQISQTQVLVGALMASFIVSWVIIMLIFSDLRYSNQVLNAQIYKAEDTIAKVKMDPRIVGATASILKKYHFFKPTKTAMLAVQRKGNATQMSAAMKLALSSVPTHSQKSHDLMEPSLTSPTSMVA